MEFQSAFLQHLQQKRNGTPLQDNTDKRSRLDGPGVEYFIEQRLVGWIIGKGGSTLKEIEQAYQVKVSLDQSSKSTGYSKVQITGPEAQISKAVGHINSSLSSAGYGDGVNGPCLLETLPTGDNGKEDIQVKQRYIGYLLGKGGAAIADIEKASGCQIFVDQETKSLGYSVVQLLGLPEQVADAKQAIELSIERAKAAREGQVAEERVEVEQRCVGWLLGKKGGVVQEIQQETGAQIVIDQTTSNLGYSTVVLKGMVDQVDSARDRVNAALEKVGATPMTAKAANTAGMGGSKGNSINTQVTVDQQWVGWLLGKNGSAVKDIEASTGAKISLNQDTKVQGYSTIALSGTPLQIQSAYEAMTESLRRAGGSLGKLPAWVTSAGGLGHHGHHGKGRESGLIDAVWCLASSLVEHSGQDALWRLLPTLQETLHTHPDVVESLKSLVPLRSGGALPLLDSSQHTQHTMDIQVQQQLVGWLLGGRGKTVQQIQDETGAKIAIDQTTKDAGYSVVHVFGSMSAVQLAERRIQSSISLANKDPKQGFGEFRQDTETTDMEVQQRLVGWILGKSGMVLKQIELQSGASVTIDQSTKELGFSKLRITGGFAQRVAARRLIEEKLVEADAAGAR